ncbi:tRNA methyltransferase ppm2 [Pichia californica]|uniref:tRNA wybutosine-synthesizing protein 4 n=1 Tax=Pichia californica TaxID=460514 RepID=A0A9P7BGA7_9ASCO|nr:tRNA methyltransferase ppm2 [[Candida] californica]
MDIYASVAQKQSGKKKKNEKDSKKNNNVKSKNKKLVHDLFVQGTNDSSIVSKRSVEILYNKHVEKEAKPYFHYFVKKTPRRTPVINRGYWIRMKSIRMAIEKIIEQQPKNQRINIINLGCGYDPLPFQLLDDAKFSNRNIYCIDVDFPELIGYKSQMIKLAPELVELIGPEVDASGIPGIDIQTLKYATMGCDLTNRDLYCKQLDSFKANNSTTTNIFIAEVSLAYMTPETANPIINTSSQFSNSHFLILEQLMPSGENHPFAKRMINHFKKMEAPLQCVHTYPTIPDQIKRFETLGYKNVNARDLLGCWDIVPNDIKLKVKEVEAFDEWEEFIFFGQHYINLHATNQENTQIYPSQYKELYPTLNNSIIEYNLNIQNYPEELQRKFHSCLSFSDYSFITCGSNQSRLSDTVQLKISSDLDAKLETSVDFKPRVGAVSINTETHSYLIGGRRIPGVGINEVWTLSKFSDTFSWKHEKSMALGRVKHTAICLNSTDILVFGGSSGECFSYYSKETDTWKDLILTSNSALKHGLESSQMVIVDDTIYLIGGMIYDVKGSFEFNSNLYKVELNFKESSVCLTSILNNKALARYGFKLIVNNSKILLIGGVGKKLYNQNDTIVEIDTVLNVVSGVKISNDIWSQSPVFIGSDIVKRENINQSWVVGGGAVCYGFGSVWNSILNFNFGEFKTEILHK